MTRAAALSCFVWTALGVVVAAQAPTTFRAVANGVLVNVSVTKNGRPVAGLTAADFEVTDNRVRQTISDVSFATLPIDVHLVADTSGSITNAQLARYSLAVRQVAAALAPGDRCEVLQFRRRVLEISPLQSGAPTAPLVRSGLDGTSFYDALSLALVTAPRPDRRQLIIALTDGVDSTSFLDWPTLRATAERTDAVLDFVSAASSASAQGPLAVSPAAVTSALRSGNELRGTLAMFGLATLAGGEVFAVGANGDVGRSFLNALAAFRQTYVVSYEPKGVTPNGWHALAVSIRGHQSYTIRARPGYDAGPPDK